MSHDRKNFKNKLFLEKFEKKNFNVNVTFNNYLNTVNTLIFSCTTNRPKNKERFNKSHELPRPLKKYIKCILKVY